LNKETIICFFSSSGPLFLEVLGTATFSVVLVFGTVGSVSKSDASSPVFSSSSLSSKVENRELTP